MSLRASLPGKRRQGLLFWSRSFLATHAYPGNIRQEWKKKCHKILTIAKPVKKKKKLQRNSSQLKFSKQNFWKFSLFMSVRRRSCKRSAQQLRDDTMNAARMERCGESNFRYMKNKLANCLGRHFNIKVVSSLAQNTASAFGCKIDRSARRKFDILILWIFERWETIGSVFLQNTREYLQNAATLESAWRRADLSGIKMIEPCVKKEALFH